jgi:hypothetical protein
MSQSDTVLHFGLGSATTFDKIEVRWPNGAVQTITGLAVDQRHTLTQTPR